MNKGTTMTKPMSAMQLINTIALAFTLHARKEKVKKTFDNLAAYMIERKYCLTLAFAVAVHLRMRDARILTEADIWNLLADHAPLLDVFPAKAKAKRPAPALVYEGLTHQGKPVPVKIGDRVLLDGIRHWVKDFYPPAHSASEGKVLLSLVPLTKGNRRFLPDSERTYYVSVIKAKWINRED